MPLPTPDFWEFPKPQRSTCLLTDDGSLTTSRLAQLLIQRGWQVVVISLPQSLVAQQPPLPPEVNRLLLTELREEYLQQQLQLVLGTYGSIEAFIHLHPVSQELHNNRFSYLKAEKAILKYVFLMAKHLKTSLTQAAHQGRSSFLTAAHLDGEFGLGGKIDFGVIGGGLFGLTKTLNLEWQGVFCRAIDFSPELDPETTAQAVITELYDPNSLILEVGYNSQGRVTLVSETPMAA